MIHGAGRCAIYGHDMVELIGQTYLRFNRIYCQLLPSLSIVVVVVVETQVALDAGHHLAYAANGQLWLSWKKGQIRLVLVSLYFLNDFPPFRH